ncbi:MAG: VCBS repeat-containing protein, partial [Steroidobacteraceae bacterium]
MLNKSLSSPKRTLMRAAAPLAGLALLPLLSSCGNDHWGNCWDCNIQPQQASYGVVSADFNGDGFADVVALNTTFPLMQGSSNLAAYLTAGSAGSFGTAVLTQTNNNPLYIASADINGDGLPDVVTASFFDGSLAVFFNDASAKGTFNAPLVLSSPGASQVAIGDVTGAGVQDLVSADYGVSLFVQTSPGTFATPVSLYSGGANWVAVGDLNGDGIGDVALTDNVGVKVLFHTGAAGLTTYTMPVSVFTATANANVIGANLIAIADVNGDGSNDLVITDPGPTGGATPTVNILLQNTATPGTFLTPVSYTIAPGDLPQSIIVADVDGDGRPDIIIGGTQTVTVLIQAHAPAAAGTFNTAVIYQAPGANE